MSLLTLPLRKDEYLRSAVGEFISERGATSVAAVDREGSYLVRDMLDALDMHIAALDELHGMAATIEAAEWEENEKRLLAGLRDSIALSRQLAGLVHSSELRERADEIEQETFWSVSDYADTPKFEAMVKESERAYAAGEWEEGGWNA